MHSSVHIPTLRVPPLDSSIAARHGAVVQLLGNPMAKSNIDMDRGQLLAIHTFLATREYLSRG